ncbi:unnamed protein product [Prorocentrum cordatum]|uniref:Uncharacterized protein n=1 Tax=Prorocentrum cordatum TaxID=2364126 RepID=A0ABN9USX5_9DINO|nr:unnamed protein product [Polarella glacialis]
MEKQLQSAQSLGAAAPAPAPAAAPAPPAIEPEVVGQAAPQQQSQLDNPLPFLGADAVKDDVEGFKKLELLADNTIEDEAALRLIAVPVLGRDPTKETTSLPPLSQVRETLGSDQFVVSDVVAFERVYVLKGTLAAGAQPGAALEAMRGRLRGTGAELFLQKSKRETASSWSS